MKAGHLSLLIIAALCISNSSLAFDVEVESLDPSSAITNQRGLDAAHKGDTAKALQYYSTAIRMAPGEWPSYYNRAIIYIKQRQWNLALQDINTIIRLKPSFLMASIIHAQIHEVMGNYTVALQDYDAILNLKPLEFTRAEVLANRAWLRATCPNASLRDGSQAVADATTACKITSWRRAAYLDALAAAHAEAGNFDEAMRFQEKAIKRAKDDRTVQAFQHRLELYRQHRPYRNA